MSKFSQVQRKPTARLSLVPAVASLALVTCGGNSLGDPCEQTSDCEGDAVCIFDVCVSDDFFDDESQEGEHQGGGGTDVELMSSCFSLPIAPYQITGYHHGSSVGGGKVHAGDDCNGNAGTPIYAIADGTVHFAGNAGTWGGLVEIKHEGGENGVFYSLYGHLKGATINVIDGQQVNRGDLLGVLGTKSENGGWAEHLHFSIFTGAHPENGVLQGHVASLAGYQDPIPWLEDNCSCACSGALESVNGTPELLQVAGNVSCNEEIDKWSIAVHDAVVYSDAPIGSSALSFSEVVDISAEGFTEGDAPIGLWARPVDGEACLVDDVVIALTGDMCIPNAKSTCVGEDVYSVDSCGNIGGLTQVCTAPSYCKQKDSDTAACEAPPDKCGDGDIDPGEECDGVNLDGESCSSLRFDTGSLACSPICTFDTSSCCTSNEAYQCDGGDVYWFNSCGEKGSLKEACDGGEVCVNDTQSTANCSSTCGNNQLDGGEQCDGGALGGATCESQGFDGGSLSCTNTCVLDTSGCTSCTIKVTSQSLGAWTPGFAPQTDCTCSPQKTDCHTLYQGRVNSLNGNTASMSFQKEGGGAPSVQVGYWVVVGEDFKPKCTDIEAFVERVSGVWSPNQNPLTVNVPVWPSQADFENAPNGETKRLFVISGDGAGDPFKRTWYQQQSVEFTKVCD